MEKKNKNDVLEVFIGSLIVVLLIGAFTVASISFGTHNATVSSCNQLAKPLNIIGDMSKDGFTTVHWYRGDYTRYRDGAEDYMASTACGGDGKVYTLSVNGTVVTLGDSTLDHQTFIDVPYDDVPASSRAILTAGRLFFGADPVKGATDINLMLTTGIDSRCQLGEPTAIQHPFVSWSVGSYYHIGDTVQLRVFQECTSTGIAETWEFNTKLQKFWRYSKNGPLVLTRDEAPSLVVQMLDKGAELLNDNVRPYGYGPSYHVH